MTSRKAGYLWEGSDKLRDESIRPIAEDPATQHRTWASHRLLAPWAGPLLNLDAGAVDALANEYVHI